MMSENGRSTLEMLPNEILLDVCKYFTARELYRVFDDLNSRFKLIINSVPNLHLMIIGNDQPIGLTFCRVIKLDLDRVHYIDLRRFSSIHSLKWISPSDTQMRKLYSSTYFPHLRQLSIYHIQDSSSIARLHQFIFSNGFPFLRKCNLSRADISRSWTLSPSLHSIHISLVNDGRVFERILASCPNLTRLNLFVLRRTQMLSSSTFQHFNLKKLYLTRSLSSQSLDNILAHVPALVQLNVKWTVHEQPTSYFQHLSNTLNVCVPYLCRFDCEFVFNGRYDDFKRIEPVLEQFHACFTHRLQFTECSYGRIRISTT
jgi:hypothetical protein